MSLLRQGRHFILIGLLQWLTDWALMVILSHAGVPVPAANIGGRIGGAILGFWLNGRFTFSRDGSAPGWQAFARYAVVWIALATLSTAAVTAIAAQSGLHAAWIGKPLVDAALSIASFIAMRHWVYR